MKIAHLVSTYPPYKGGMGNVCYEQAKGLAALGHEVTVFTPYNPKGLYGTGAPVKVIYLKPFFRFGNAAVVPQVGSCLKDFDLIYLHWPFIGGAEVILLRKLLQNFLRKSASYLRLSAFSSRKSASSKSASSQRESALVVQYHMDLIGQGWRDLFFKFYQSIFLPLMVRRAKKIVVSSLDYASTSALKKFFSKYQEKFIELPLGVDLEKFFPQEPDQELKKKLGLKQIDKIVLFIAGLDKAHYFKGLGVLLPAMAKVEPRSVPTCVGATTGDKNIKLIVGGEGDLKEKYQKMAIDLGIKDKVIFVGEISDEQLVKFYNLADVFVLPSISRSEAFGLVLLEAMACAKPIIVSDLPGPRTLVGENGFLVKPGDVDDLAKKINLILKDNQLIKKMGENARKLVVEKYDWKEIVKKLSAFAEGYGGSSDLSTKALAKVEALREGGEKNICRP